MKTKKQAKDYEDLGRMLVSIYENGYTDRKSAYKFTFIKGVIGGFGGVLGATIVIALLIWLLSVLEYVPFVRLIVDDVQETLQSQ